MTDAAQPQLPDYYGVLGVPPTADREAIRQAYRRLALQHHPDRGGTHEMMLRLNAAFEVLGNPTHRESYDQARAHKDDAALNARAETVSRAAEERAGDYPQNYGEFETWLDGICADFKNAKYGRTGKGAYDLPTAENSTSGGLFILAGACITGYLLFGPFDDFRMKYVKGPPVVLIIIGGAWLGRYVHEFFGAILGGPPNPSPDDLPRAEPVPQPPPQRAPEPVPALPSPAVSSTGDEDMTGNYHGTCTNTALDPPITAVLELTLRRVAASVIEGRLQLSGELTGGSDFVGVLERANQIRFQTVEPGQSLIEWRGRWQDGEFSGDYVARLSAPGLVERGLGTQQGVWRCVKRASARPAPKQRKSATSGAKPNPSRSRTKRQP